MNGSIANHLERHLGPIARGWASIGEPAGIQICLFRSQPIPAVSTYSTLGLSRHVLALPHERAVRQELLLATRDLYVDDDLSKLLLHLAQGIIDEHRALLRGNVITLGHAICKGSKLTSLYVSVPVVFPQMLATCVDTEPPTIFAWLIPIAAEEAALIGRAGWDPFEEFLEQEDPDLFDLLRHSSV